MKVDIKKIGGSRLEITVEEATENVAKYRSKVIASASKNANIKGFRKGTTIPEAIIVKEFGEEVILQMTIEQAIDGIYKDTLKKEKLMPVSQAEIKEIVSQNPLIVKIEVEIFPEVEMQESYRKVQLTRSELSVSAQEVEDALADIQTRFTHFHDTGASHEAHMGDRVTIDTDGYDADGKLLEATSMRDYPLVLGSNMLVPGFEEDMVGMKAGDERELDVNFPKEYHNAEFAGKKTKFRVAAKKIEHAHKPEFTPEFIKDLRGKEMDLAGFKKQLKEEILDTKQANDAMERESLLIDELLKHTTFDIGENLLAQQTQQVFEEIKENISKDGVNMGDYLASLNMDEEAYKQKHVTQTATKRLSGEIILNKIMELENTEVSDSEMKQEIERVMSNYESVDVLKRLAELYVPGSRYYEELKRRMAYKKLIETFFVEAKK